MYQHTIKSTRKKKGFFITGKEDLKCPSCGEPLKYRDRKRRIHRIAGGKKEWYKIRRFMCMNPACKCKYHEELPDELLPYKHYDAQLTEDVIEGVITSDDPETENYPCEDTMENWKNWWERNERNAEGLIRSAAYRLLDLSLEFLSSTDSLLGELKERMHHCEWLKTVIKAIYNTGGRLPAEPASAPG